MKKAIKIVGGLLVVVLAVVASVLGYFAMSWGATYPDTPTPDIARCSSTSASQKSLSASSAA